MKRFISLLSFLVSCNFIFCQHNDIIFDIPTDIAIQINQGDFYWIDLGRFEVNGTKYDYGRYIDIAKDKKIYKNYDAGIVLLEGGGKIFPLDLKYGRFKGESGMYRIIFNVDISHSSVNVSGTLTLVNKITHLNRNKYNKVAKGMLIRKSGEIFIDENGCEWELQNQCFNAFHKPIKNAKFLHKVAGGGEYETIREIKATEGQITTFICPDSDIIPVKTMKIIDIEADTLKGSNVLNDQYQSSYNFGHTGLSSFLKHRHLDMLPHEQTVWGGNYKPTNANSHIEGCKNNLSSTLFLFDLSGSMNDNGGGTIPKIEQAKQASKTTLNGLVSNSQGVTNQVAVYGFSGGCTPDPTIEISPFTDDLISVDAKIDGMRAGGGTPLSNALRAAECKMAAHLQKEGQQKGKLIILSDGQGSCGNIRPNGVYNSAPLQKNRSVMIDASQCGGGGGGQTAVSYYTVGFNIPPGSHAERDLQYLSQISGGKYLNVQNQTQLVRAFRKFNRVYQPKPNPALSGHPSQSVQDFSKGVAKIKEEYFKDALAVYESFTKAHPDDCHGYYNLALAQEANDFFKEAIKNYQQYLSICPDAFDRAFVEKQISFLEDEFREFVLFQKEVIKSDLAFLNLHFQKIQNGQSVVLAAEFKGFLQEKDDYYEILPRLIGSEDSDLMSLAEDLTSAFQQCAKLIRKSPNSWDQDAIPIISMSYLNLEELIELL